MDYTIKYQCIHVRSVNIKVIVKLRLPLPLSAIAGDYRLTLTLTSKHILIQLGNGHTLPTDYGMRHRANCILGGVVAQSKGKGKREFV